MSDGQGYQFTPFGFTPLGDASGAVGDAMMPGAVPASRPEPEQPVAATRPVVRPRAQKHSLSPRDVVKATRARIKEIRAELKRHARLKKELAQLERMLAAANGETLAPVRAIDTARRAG